MTYNRYLNEVTSYFFRAEAAIHNVDCGRELTWAHARLLWKQARVQARRIAEGVTRHRVVEFTGE